MKCLFKPSVKYIRYIYLCTLCLSSDKSEKTDRTGTDYQYLVPFVNLSSVKCMIADGKRLNQCKFFCR